MSMPWHMPRTRVPGPSVAFALATATGARRPLCDAHAATHTPCAPPWLCPAAADLRRAFAHLPTDATTVFAPILSAPFFFCGPQEQGKVIQQVGLPAPRSACAPSAVLPRWSGRARPWGERGCSRAAPRWHNPGLRAAVHSARACVHAWPQARLIGPACCGCRRRRPLCALAPGGAPIREERGRPADRAQREQQEDPG